jgi:hypothetical protein
VDLFQAAQELDQRDLQQLGAAHRRDRILGRTSEASTEGNQAQRVGRSWTHFILQVSSKRLMIFFLLVGIFFVHHKQKTIY